MPCYGGNLRFLKDLQPPNDACFHPTMCQWKKTKTDLSVVVFYYSLRYIRSERSIILLNFCLSIVCSNILILVGQTQTHNVVSVLDFFFFFLSLFCILFKKCGGCVFFCTEDSCAVEDSSTTWLLPHWIHHSPLYFLCWPLWAFHEYLGGFVLHQKKKNHGCGNIFFYKVEFKWIKLPNGWICHKHLLPIWYRCSICNTFQKDSMVIKFFMN